VNEIRISRSGDAEDRTYQAYGRMSVIKKRQMEDDKRVKKHRCK